MAGTRTGKNNQAETQAKDYALLVSHPATRQYSSTVTMSCSIVEYDADRKIRNISSSYGDDMGYADLAVWCYLAEKEDAYHAPSYGWACEYRDVYSVDASRARLMAATLTRIDKARERMNDEDGYAQTFGQFAARCAKALGIKRIVILPRNQHGRYDDLDLQRCSSSEGAHLIDKIIAGHYAAVCGVSLPV